MASTVQPPRTRDLAYPTSDRRPVAETDRHREIMFALIKILQAFYAGNSQAYVSGNLLIFYEQGNRRKHVSPDVFVTLGVPKRERLNYLIWEETKGPDVVIELTSASTKDEDLHDKFHLYQDTLKVPEYFLFDPRGEYLSPQIQGHRLQGGAYAAIGEQDGRLPSHVLGLHLERHGSELRLYNPQTGAWLPTPEEEVHQERAARLRTEAEMEQERAARLRTESEMEQERAARLRTEAELRRVREELAALRKGSEAQ